MTEKKQRRNTRQRQVILEGLMKLSSHPTAKKLHEIARRRLRKLSLGTVYRNLELLARDGTIQKLEVSGTESRFDGNPALHHHVRCVRCGRVDDLHGLHVDLPGGTFRSANGYDVIGHRLELIGVCPECRGHPASEHDPGGPRDGE